MKKPSRSSTARSRTTGHYIASTHWDREWYESFQEYRFRLVDVLDQVLALLESDPEYASFQVDGQTSPIDDYLEIRPENRERLRALCQAGRLQLGPWYTMPDEFIPCGESLVRNLLYGHGVAREFGTPMKVGFVCDIFGHNSQLPQIFRGFGIRTAVVWRGTNYPKYPGLFRWQAANGDEVLTYAFEARGYCQYYSDVRQHNYTPQRTLDLDRALQGLRQLMRTEQERTPGNEIVLFDGLDHVPAEPATSELLRRARQRGLAVRHSSFAEFFDAIRRQKLKLPMFRGELREPGERGGQGIIPGVLSSREYLKQANSHCESYLTHWAEPFAAFATLLGHAYPAGYLKVAWRNVLLNHAHDSICGCSIDQVHRDMQYRFDQARLIADRATQLSLRAVADRTRLPKLKAASEFAVTLFNAAGADRTGVVDFPLPFPQDTEFRFQEWFGYEPIVGFRLHDVDGQEVPYQRVSVTKAVPMKSYNPLSGYSGGLHEEVRVAARLNIPAHGWTTLVCRPTKERTRSAGSQVIDDHTMENEHLRVTINPNGTLDLYEKAEGHTYRDLLLLEDRADIGDGWYHGTAVNDEFFSSHGAAADVALVHDGFALTTFRVRVTLNVPECFLADKQTMRRSSQLVPLHVTHWLTLRAGATRLEVRTEVANTVRDHRLRVLLPTGLPVETYFADGPFDVAERPIAISPNSHLFEEQEVETKPQYSFTAVCDGVRGLAVVSAGQRESAVRDLPERPIALTLFRAFAKTVGKTGEQGGQMLGPTQHVYWICPLRGVLPTAELLHLGQQIATGLECIYTEPSRQPLLRKKPALPATGAWLTPGPGPLVLTARKISEDGAAVVLRLFNPTAEAATQDFEFVSAIRSAHRANLLEEPEMELTPSGRTLSVTAQPREIVTLRLVLTPLK